MDLPTISREERDAVKVNSLILALRQHLAPVSAFSEGLWDEADAAAWLAALGIVNAAGGPTNIRVVTSSTTYPIVTNPNVKVLCWLKGGGASGAGSAFATNNFGGGGGEGAVSWKLTTAGALSGQTITIGPGGAAIAAATDTNGNNGGTTSVGTICTAPGGNAGRNGGTGGIGGAGGVGGTNDWGEPGISGDIGGDASGTIPIGPKGGGRGGGPVSTAGQPNSGGGGGGGWRHQGSGAGGSGIAVFIEFGAIN